MNLLDSLLDAIVRLDGDALVMHVGEKPYVVTTSEATNQFRGPLAWGQVELSTRVLTTDAVSGMLGQILPLDQRAALDEFGATDYGVTAANHPEERFTIVAARGGDDIWVEMRRHPRVPAAETMAPAPEQAIATVPSEPVEQRAAEPAPLEATAAADMPVIADEVSGIEAVEISPADIEPEPEPEPVPVAMAAEPEYDEDVPEPSDVEDVLLDFEPEPDGEIELPLTIEVVPDLEESATKDRPSTVREQLERHRANPTCAACHRNIDPVGFALENFDAVGQWRVQTREGLSIDSAGVLTDGTKIDGPSALRKALLSRPDVFTGTVTEKLLIYALGRGLEPVDMPVVRNIVRGAAGQNYAMQAILLGIVKSDPFQMRTKLTDTIGKPSSIQAAKE